MEKENCPLNGNVLHLAGIIRESIVDGPGMRFVVFVQGCPHNCPGCQNMQAHSFDGGAVFTLTGFYRKFRKTRC